MLDVYDLPPGASWVHNAFFSGEVGIGADLERKGSQQQEHGISLP